MTALADVSARARSLEARGFDGAMTAEVSNDPFLPLTLAAEHTSRIDLITGITVAFARSPMTLAQIGHDLNAYSHGRLVLGLGSQVRAHITRRFSMPWSRPAARMREFVLAMRAIWSAWYDGAPLDFQGEFYTHTLMTPMFTPSDRSQGRPRVMIAGVNPRMTEVAAEVADGFVAHGFTTAQYLREVTVPAIERGLAKAGKSRDAFEILCPVFVVTGDTEEVMAGTRQMVCSQIAFYGSTPAYRPVLDFPGWGDLQSELHRMSREGRWAEMGGLIDDDVLHRFAVVAEPGDVAGALRERCGGLVDRLLWTAAITDAAVEAEQIARLRA